jgi:hypothetical protein
MSLLNTEEAIRFFKSYGFRVDEGLVKEWGEENNKRVNSIGENRSVEDDPYRYNDWCYVKVQLMRKASMIKRKLRDC